MPALATLPALVTHPGLGTNLTPSLATLLVLPALATATRTLSTHAALPAPARRVVVTSTGWLILLGT